jgi:endoglucanase
VVSIPRLSRRKALLAGGVAAVVAAAVSGLVAIQANAETAGELVVNGTFDSGQAPWFVTVSGGVTGGQLCANVAGGLANPWDAIVGQNDMTVSDGVTYTFKFTASATKNVTVRALVGQQDAPFGTQTDKAPQLTTSAQDFSYTFTANATWTNTQVAFQLGGSNDPFTFCVDNVSLAPFAAEQVANGDFSAGMAPWFNTGNTPATVTDGKLCANVPAGTTNPWDSIIGQNDITVLDGDSYTLSFDASASKNVVVRALVGQEEAPFGTQVDKNPALTPTMQTFSYSFTSNATWDKSAQVAFQLGGSTDAWTFCLDNVSLKGGAAPPAYTPDTGPRVRVNQVAYLPKGPKNATVVTAATDPLAWELHNSANTVVAHGMTTPRGNDVSSGQNVQSIDFSAFTGSGTGFTLVADGETSFPFDIDSASYEKLRQDSLKWFYTQRSGIEILDSLRPGYARPAGHTNVAPNQGDNNVPCQPGVCDYTLNVQGGWYDAGDHGKYVVNGGISVFQLMNEFERTKVAATAKPGKLGDSTLALPESGNGVPDILDEARWEMDFLLSMQVPADKPLAGMAHHKVHDENWTGLPLLPNKDPMKRELHPPSTAATLNLAASAAQAARVFAPYDAAFSAKALAAAKAAWTAALAHPTMYALVSDGNGGGAYDDSNVTDEFYWAAAELFITTGESQYADFIHSSPLHTSDIFPADGFSWQYVAPLGRLDLALIPNNLSDRAAVRASVLAGADKYLATVAAHPYGLPYAPAGNMYAWGSNSSVLNNMVVLGAAFDVSGASKYRDAVLQGFNYLLGRNALNESYVTGYGEKNSHQQHSRWYAHELNSDLPSPPAGSLAGGANSGIQDPTAASLLKGCAPQFCYIDEIQSYSTNEVAINWNSTLAWVSAFVADQADGTAPAPSTCKVTYSKTNVLGLFAAAVTITNTGSSTVNGWTLNWAYTADQRVVIPIGANVTQTAASVSAANVGLNRRIAPHQTVAFAFLGSGSAPNFNPGLFLLNGQACS